MKELLIYKTVANSADDIQFSALRIEKTGQYVMPSLRILKDGKEVLYADNPDWFVQHLIPALKRFDERSLTADDREHLDSVLEHFPTVYDQIEAVEWIGKILDYAIAAKMLTTPNPELSVASKAESETPTPTTKNITPVDPPNIELNWHKKKWNTPDWATAPEQSQEGEVKPEEGQDWYYWPKKYHETVNKLSAANTKLAMLSLPAPVVQVDVEQLAKDWFIGVPQRSDGIYEYKYEDVIRLLCGFANKVFITQSLSKQSAPLQDVEELAVKELEERTERNMKVVGDFIDHLKKEAPSIRIPEKHFLSFFNA